MAQTYINLWRRITIKIRNATSLGDRQSGFRMKNKATKHTVKFHLITYPEGPDGQSKYRWTHSLISALDEGGWSTPLSDSFIPGKRCTGTCEGPRTVVESCGKSRLPQPGFYPRAVQPVESYYTYWAISDHKNNIRKYFWGGGGDRICFVISCIGCYKTVSKLKSIWTGLHIKSWSSHISCPLNFIIYA